MNFQGEQSDTQSPTLFTGQQGRAEQPTEYSIVPYDNPDRICFPLFIRYPELGSK
jgi:hypothetical protein